MHTSRRTFLKQGAALLASSVTPLPLSWTQNKTEVMTVNGLIKARQMGMSLIHEHILVDFIGADKISFDRWNHKQVVKKVLPYLQEIKDLGVQTLVECTPAYLGRDARLLDELSDRSEVQIITNTGYYGARQNQHLPQHAFGESAEQLADRWIKEFEKGIDGTNIKPGFMKIGVDTGSLSEMHRKLITAAAITHKATGLSIASHTGEALAAFEQMQVLQEQGVQPSAFIWVHSQNEKDTQQHVEAARQGAWVSLDSVNESNVNDYLNVLKKLKAEKLLHRVLLSHDAGWYKPEEAHGGEFRPYTDIFEYMLPALRDNGFSKANIKTMMEKNPAQAFTLAKRLVQ
jgi:phosphotriesterase-related protein